MTIPEVATKVRAALVHNGTTISATRAQDVLFDLYDVADEVNRLLVQDMLTLTLERLWFASHEIETILTQIEAQVSEVV